MNRLQQLQAPTLTARFAPTPSGYLHIGNVYSFLLTWLLTRREAGQILLRIDDLDRDRMRPEYVENIFRVLEWLELDWDLGPKSVDEFEAGFSQRHRMELYQARLQQLKERQLIFACNCSRKQLKEADTGGVYTGACKDKSVPLDTEEVAWRMKTDGPSAVAFAEYGQGLQKRGLPGSQQYFIVRRRDGIPAYHLASVADDEFFKINFVVRGSDLYDSTLAQLFLAQQLEAETFAHATFLHHPLIYQDHQKLSKSQQSASVLDDYYPDKGKLFRKLGSWLGLLPEQSESLEAIFTHFTPVALFNLPGN